MKKNLLILLAIFLVMAACSRHQADDFSVMRYGFTTEPVTLDPLSPSYTADSASILFNVFEGLVKPDTEGRLQPCLAESFSMDEYGKVYNFAIRPNVLFHDGSPLTASDIKFSLETAIASGFTGMDEIDRIETEGDYGIKIILKSANTEFLPFLTVGIVKAESKGRDKKAVGTGPFFIENYSVQQTMTLKKFENYWQENIPRLEKVTIVFFADSDTLILGLRGGGIDGASLTGNLSTQLDTEHFDLEPEWSAMVQLLALNNAAPPLDDIRIRKAINYGLDIQGIIDTAFFAKGEPSGSPLIPGLKAFYEESLRAPWPLDPEKALALLDEAGYGKNGNQLTLEITVPSNYTEHVDTAQVIASQLEKIGIITNIKLVDWATWLADVYSARKYQSTIISVHSPTVSPRGFLYRYRSDNENNFINYSSPVFDNLYDAILEETDEEKRIELYKEAQRVISEDAASVFIQDILGFRALRAGTYGGVLSYPLHVIDFASMYLR